MNRLEFEFRRDESLVFGFQPSEFRGLSEPQIREALRQSIGIAVNDDDIAHAAKTLYDAAQR